jgi:hypothetical protein
MVDKKEKTMYNVTYKDASDVACEKEFEDLTSAMNWAKELNYFVSIKGNGMEVVGKFGVDAVKDGKCPDGVAYDWNKASRIGAVRRK